MPARPYRELLSKSQILLQKALTRANSGKLSPSKSGRSGTWVTVIAERRIEESVQTANSHAARILAYDNSEK
jgi:hypothetical protein